MDEQYDVIVLGTGLKECILSGLLSVDKKKVLHMDRNNYYGGESASLNLNQLYERFRNGDKPPEAMGASRDWNVDLVPKFIMANGKLVKVLVHTNVTRYLDFKAVGGSFVYNKGKVCKVPATDLEALRSPLMGLFEKRRARSFFIYVQGYDHSDPKTWKQLDLTRMTSAQLYHHFGLEDMTVDFIGHALALYTSDEYLHKPALDMVQRVKLYHDSLLRFEGLKSPYIYPLYGLGELPQAFARLSAVYGGTYMLNKSDCKVEYDESGKAIGVTSEGQTAKCKMVVGDPTYFPDKCEEKFQIVRAICVVDHPIPNTDNSDSCQIIIPQKQTGRQNDVYVFTCGAPHQVSSKGRYLAFVATKLEGSTRLPEEELAVGLSLIGTPLEKFVEVVDVMAPKDPDTEQGNNCFISVGYDPTTHFESTVDDVLQMYARITGKPLDLSSKPVIGQEEE